MKFSSFSQPWSAQSGIVRLMDDLGTAMAEQKDMLMLGGGNPAHIPELEVIFQNCWNELGADRASFARLVGDYDPPQGNPEFLDNMAAFLNRQYNWGLTRKNIALANGGQHAFFMLMHLFGGPDDNGNNRRVCFPLCPEYIGYSDLPMCEDMYVAQKPEITINSKHRYKYHIDFDQLDITEDIAALCVSRPCNPTGNVITDEEMHLLSERARAAGIPIIIDNAYGLPFPNIIFGQATPIWDEHIILTMSLSKLGMPALRCGIIVAAEEIIEKIAAANTIMSLAPSSIGSAMANKLIKDDTIIELSNNIIKPYYYEKVQRACAQLEQGLQGLPCYIHEPEGALFLWLWAKDLPINSQELYERLKARGVLIVPGKYFFPGFAEQWQHCEECIRISYAMDDDVVEKGLTIIIDELRNLYN